MWLNDNTASTREMRALVEFGMPAQDWRRLADHRVRDCRLSRQLFANSAALKKLLVLVLLPHKHASRMYGRDGASSCAAWRRHHRSGHRGFSSIMKRSGDGP
jgi:hypothetical protein